MNERPQKIIDAKLPLPWLIGCAASIVFAFGGVFFKLESVSATMHKLEAKTDNRDERISAMMQTLIQQQGKNDTQDLLLNMVQQEVTAVRRDIEDVRKTQRWMPK